MMAVFFVSANLKGSLQFKGFWPIGDEQLCVIFSFKLILGIQTEGLKTFAKARTKKEIY